MTALSRAAVVMVPHPAIVRCIPRDAEFSPMTWPCNFNTAQEGEVTTTSVLSRRKGRRSMNACAAALEILLLLGLHTVLLHITCPSGRVSGVEVRVVPRNGDDERAGPRQTQGLKVEKDFTGHEVEEGSTHGRTCHHRTCPG